MNYDVLNSIAGCTVLGCFTCNIIALDVITLCLAGVMGYAYMVGWIPGKFWKAEVMPK